MQVLKKSWFPVFVSHSDIFKNKIWTKPAKIIVSLMLGTVLKKSGHKYFFSGTWWDISPPKVGHCGTFCPKWDITPKVGQLVSLNYLWRGVYRIIKNKNQNPIFARKALAANRPLFGAKWLISGYVQRCLDRPWCPGP